ncbi:replication initiator, partial [Streptosporangium sp. NPDC001559]|uniref:replication initiator n=1 Tax=Streptosporangium sp. NPDC001559 TaxID=3366187 RepID=UPI0036E1DA7C
AGLTLRELRAQCTISFAKVAEYQRRGVVHFHAVIRLDGPDGPTFPPPTWATAEMLADAVRHAAHAVTATTPATADEPARTLRWGRQLDAREITLGGELSDQAVAGYIAKYATKAAECVGALDRRINPLDDLEAFNLRDHPRRLIAECMRLGALDEYADLRLTQWAHMLGFHGHFSTRSRHYSTTMGAIRDERRDHARLPLFDEDTVLVISHWEYAGKGLSAGDALLAALLSGDPPSPASPDGGGGR